MEGKGHLLLEDTHFQRTVQLNAKELHAIPRICLFTITLAWLTAPVTCDAPYNDLCFLQSIEAFHNIDSEVADVTLFKIKGHLWYVNEDLVGLSIFFDKVFADEKKQMVSAFIKPQNKIDLRRVDKKTNKTYQDKTLPEFVAQRSMHLFTALKLSRDFLSLDPETWNSRENYRYAKDTVVSLHVVNDCAEHVIKLATDFNLALTQDEEQRQLIFQVI